MRPELAFLIVLVSEAVCSNRPKNMDPTLLPNTLDNIVLVPYVRYLLALPNIHAFYRVWQKIAGKNMRKN